MNTNYRDRFSLPADCHYINCAYQSPLLKSSAEVGMAAFNLKSTPTSVARDDFFKPMEIVKHLFSQLINCDNPQRIVLIPSASYGLASAAANIHVRPHQKIVLTYEQFPSNYYVWERLAAQSDAHLQIVKPTSNTHRGESWNENIISAIDQSTAVVALPQSHWADGTLFDLEAIGKKCREMGARFVIDGTQSVGAYPFDIEAIKPDALICAGYKWLLGHFGSGLAYYGPNFDNGMPIEENWINRKDSQNFESLVDYQLEYRPYAYRYGMGESWNMINTAVFQDSLSKILDWGVETIQSHCQQIFASALEELSTMGCWVEKSPFRGHHLFGIRVNGQFDLQKLLERLIARKIYVSQRGNAIRVSPHLYNTIEDVHALLETFRISRI